MVHSDIQFSDVCIIGYHNPETVHRILFTAAHLVDYIARHSYVQLVHLAISK